MANTSRLGFRPVGTLSGKPWSGSVRRYKVDYQGLSVGIGDLVALETDGNVNIISAVTCSILGAVVAVDELIPTDVTGTGIFELSGSTTPSMAKYHAVGSNAYVHVAMAGSGDVIFEAEGTAAIGAAHIGETINATVTTVNTTTGVSQMCLSMASGSNGTGAAGQFKIIDVKRSVDNDLTATNSKVYVICNAPQFTHGSAGV